MYPLISLWSHFEFIYNVIAMCPPSTGRAHQNRIPTFQHTRVEVELEVELEVDLRVGLGLSSVVGVGSGSRSGGRG